MRVILQKFSFKAYLTQYIYRIELGDSTETSRPTFYKGRPYRLHFFWSRTLWRSFTVSTKVTQPFLTIQQLAYDVAKRVANELRPGQTEKDAAQLLRKALQKEKIDQWFHVPFAWFGKRTRFEGMKSFKDFLPSNCTLGEGDVFILDIAPISNGYVGDIGYTTTVGPNENLRLAKNFLLSLRDQIPNLVGRLPTMSEVYETVERQMRKAGYDPCHLSYPFGVLGHRVHRMGGAWLPSLTLPFGYLSWFPLRSQWTFLLHGISSELLNQRHRGGKNGFWAIEPHIGGEGFGAKFEEILVVEDDRAYWLSDDISHLLTD